MRKRFSKYVFTVVAVCALSLTGSAAYSQDRDHDRDQDSGHHKGLVQDWSGHHVNYSRMGPRNAIIAAQSDVRALDSWAASIRKDGTRWHFGERVSSGTTQHRDWSISLGLGSINATMYPAKYTWDPNATPLCTDFIVYPVNIAGSTTQPNIVAFANLYSGTTPTVGLCNRLTPPAGDLGNSATVLWSYDINAIGGTVAISPTVSLDGNKVAFVESAAGVPAHFHVLAGKSGDGVDTTTPNAQNVLLPKVITSFAANAPAAGSGAVTDLTLGSTASDTNTLSSPFIDYAFDYAYVGNDDGKLFRVTHVFCTQDPACSGGTPPAPSLDTVWGTAGVSVCPGFKMTGPVKDGVSGNIFVGCSNGLLYGLTTSGATVTNFPVTVGDGTATGGVVDPPMVDSVNGWVYATAGSSGGGTAVLVQASTTGASLPTTATLGAGGQFNVHAPAFNDAYFSSGTSTNWLMYVFGIDTTDVTDELFGVGFTGSHLMNAGTPATVLVSPGGTPKVEFSPLTEFLNGANDQLFFSSITALTPNFYELPITTFPASYGTVTVATEGDGTGGIVIDNASADAQASSIYFGTITANTAVKLTQTGLN